MNGKCQGLEACRTPTKHTRVILTSSPSITVPISEHCTWKHQECALESEPKARRLQCRALVKGLGLQIRLLGRQTAGVKYLLALYQPKASGSLWNCSRTKPDSISEVVRRLKEIQQGKLLA